MRKKALARQYLYTLQILGKISPRKNELIIINDGSTDSSSRIIQSFKKIYRNVNIITHKTNLGIGRSLIDGYSSARNENICVIPGDGQFDLNNLIPYAYLKKDEFVSFYRKENLEYSFFRNILSLINRKLNNIFFGIDIKDVNWVKIYKRYELQKIDLNLKSSLVESEICIKLILQGKRLIQQESKYLPRSGGKCKGDSPKIIWQATIDIIKLFIAINKYKYNELKTLNEFERI